MSARNPRETQTITRQELADFLDPVPSGRRSLVRALRALVRRTAPRAGEAVRFNSLCYFRPAASYGAIGGNICMIEASRGGIRLSFIQGAMLPDPEGLLRGSGKAKRFVEIGSVGQLGGAGVVELIRVSEQQAAERAEAEGDDRKGVRERGREGRERSGRRRPVRA